MADKNIQMKIKNGATWDNLYPKTKVALVEGLEALIEEELGNLSASDIPTLSLAKISDAGTAASKNTGTAAGNVPILDGSGKLDANVVPAIAISDTFVVANQTAMLALTAEIGDVAVRSDLSKTFILKTSGASTLENWQELLFPTSPVSSVAGKTGTVTLVKGDVGLSSVDNTSDANKPVSTATQDALNTKASITVSATEPSGVDFWYQEI